MDSVDNVNEGKTTMKLTDVNTDCLQSILIYLNLRDLLNLADTNKYVKSAADLVFLRIFGKKTLFLRVMFPYSDEMIEVSQQKIEINDLKTSLQLMRCFGALISQLEYDFSIESVPRHRSELDRYINDYCAESLKEMEFFTISEEVFENIEKPFLNAKSVRFNYCTLGKKLSDFNKWFPKMSHLRLYRNLLVDPKCIEAHFPYLEQLEICNKEQQYDVMHFEERNLEEALRLNPQLQTIKIGSGFYS